MSSPESAPTWETVLDHLEADLAEADALLERPAAEPDDLPVPSAPWAPPSGLGPLPDELTSRARQVLARQRDTTRRLTLAARSNEAQRGFASRVAEATHAPAGPAYLDVSA